MIDKNEFTKCLSNYQLFEKAINRLSQAFWGNNSHVIYCDWCDYVGNILDAFIESHFTEQGADWIYYYLFETIEDKLVIVKREKDIFNEESELKYHLNSIDELWDFLLTDKKAYFKNA